MRPRAMLIRDRMSRPVVTIRPDATAADGLATMYAGRKHRLPVVDRDALVGIVTWKDLAAPRGGAESCPPTDTPVGRLMTANPITVPPEAPIEVGAALMRQFHIGGIPVLDSGRLVGIITESDVFDAFADLLGPPPGGTRLTVTLPEHPRALAELVAACLDCGTEIRSLTHQQPSEVLVRIDAPHPLHLLQTLAERGFTVTDFSAL
jgi:acetoin utilization protein AcuB